MPGTATVTGQIGPARVLTTQVFTNLRSFGIDSETEILTLVYAAPPSTTVQIDISAATTITCTVVGNTYTLTIS